MILYNNCNMDLVDYFNKKLKIKVNIIKLHFKKNLLLRFNAKKNNWI